MGEKKKGNGRNPDQGEQATGSCWDLARVLLVHGSRGVAQRRPGGHGSWATSHWETARDQRIRAARFTTIKMRKGKQGGGRGGTLPFYLGNDICNRTTQPFVNLEFISFKMTSNEGYIYVT